VVAAPIHDLRVGLQRERVLETGARANVTAHAAQ